MIDTTNTNAPLRGFELLAVFFEAVNNKEGIANEVSAIVRTAQGAGWETTGEALYEMKVEIDQAYKKYEAIKESEALTEGCLVTFNRDAQQFAAVAYAPVKMAYMKMFGDPWNVIELDQAQQVWVKTYKRLARTEWGITVINQTRTIVVTWFAKWGNPAAGDFDVRLAYLFAEWDAWESEAGGLTYRNGSISNDAIDDLSPHTTDYNKRFGTCLAIVMATDAYYADNEGNEEALKIWPKHNTTYPQDVAYIVEQLNWLHEGNNPALFDTVLDTFISLINQTHRFQNISGMWAVERLQELLDLQPEGVVAEGRW